MTWKLVGCATNDTAWNERWQKTRGLDEYARAGSLVAVNAHGNVRLADVSDPLSVKPRGELELPEFGVGLPEEYPVAFVGDRVLAQTDNAIHEIDVSKPAAPKLAATHTFGKGKQLRHGTFIDGVLYTGSFTEPGLLAIRGREQHRFSPTRSAYLPPAAFAEVGDLLYVIGTSSVEVFQLDGSGAPSKDPIVRKKCDTASRGRVHLTGDLLAVVSGVSGRGVQVIDIAKPKNPKVQKRPYKPEPRGSGIAGETLLVVDGPYQKHLALTRITLGRPASQAAAAEPFTEDPEISCGLLFIEPLGDCLFVLGNTGRFAVLAPGAR